jgi:hypothetical protein
MTTRRQAPTLAEVMASLQELATELEDLAEILRNGQGRRVEPDRRSAGHGQPGVADFGRPGPGAVHP